MLEQMRGKPEKEIRKAVSAAYPFGDRHYWPYKMWCDEVKRLLGTKQKPAAKGAYQKLREWEELYGGKREEEHDVSETAQKSEGG